MLTHDPIVKPASDGVLFDRDFFTEAPSAVAEQTEESLRFELGGDEVERSANFFTIVAGFAAKRLRRVWPEVYHTIMNTAMSV